MPTDHDKDKNFHSLFYAVRDRRFGKATCFLCGKRLGTRNRTDEHVIPLWLQNRFGLLNQRLHLLNRTTIPYRQLTIPCCSECNNIYLGTIEKKVQQAVINGAKAVKKLDPKILFVWLGKIFYGLLYKELFLPIDRSKPRKGRITNRDLLQQFEMHHLFLQSCRKPIQFENFFPASIFVFDVQELAERKACFDLRDNLPSLFISLRMGKVGVLASLQDGGALSWYLSPLYNKFKSLKLHPYQYLEIVARVLYASTLFNRTPKYLSTSTADQVRFVQMPLQGLSSKPIFNQHDNEDYAQVLLEVMSQIPGITLDKIYAPPDRVMTWLTNMQGKRMFLDINSFPI